MKLKLIFTYFLLVIIAGAKAQTYGSSSQIFDYANGAIQYFTVPPGVTSVVVELWGRGYAPGSSDKTGGGGGAYTRSTALTVAPGTLIPIKISANLQENSEFGSTISANGSTSRLGAAASSGSNIAASYKGGDGGYGNASGSKTGGGGGAAGRDGNGGDAGSATTTLNGTAGTPAAGGGYGGARSSSNTGGYGIVPGGGNAGKTSYDYTAGRVIVWWTCPTPLTNNTLGNGFSVPVPLEDAGHSISIKTAPPANTGITYTWQFLTSVNVWKDVTSTTGTVSPFLISNSNITSFDTFRISYFRLRSSSCNAVYSYSNSVKIGTFSNANISAGVPSKNGKFVGFVKSKNNVGIPNVTVQAIRYTSLLGAPYFITYSAVTASDGSYEINNIFYGDKDNGDPVDVSFSVQPTQANHGYLPSQRIGALNYSTTGNGVKIDDFQDTTVLSVVGRVYQQCKGCLNSSNAVVDTIKLGKDSTKITGGDAPVYTNVSGDYGTTVQNPGSKTFTPSYKNHQFNPVSFTTNISAVSTTINFEDTSTYSISGKVTAGGGDVIGTAVLSFRDTIAGKAYTFKKTVTSSGANGTYAIRLPGRKYKVFIESFTPSLPSTDSGYVSQANFVNFFNLNYPKDSLVVNLDTANAVFNLIYRRPPVIQISGLPDTTCGAYIAFHQNAAKKFLVNVYEGPVSKGLKVATNDVAQSSDSLFAGDSIRIFTDVPDITGTAAPKTIRFRLTKGSDSVIIVPGVPNIVAPFSKVFRVDYVDRYGRSATSINRDCKVIGIQSPPQTFVTVAPEMPTLVLHAPPGDQSYSFWNQNKSIETAMSFSASKSTEASGFEEVNIGANFGAGIGVVIQTEIIGQINNTTTSSFTNTSTNEGVISNSTSVNYQTSPGTFGSGGDVFIGGAMNYKYGISNVVKYNNACQLSLSDQLIIAPTSFATTFTYSEYYILNTLMPALQYFVAHTTDAQQSYYINQLNVWQQVIDNNNTQKENAQFVENRSFDGNTGGITVSKTFSHSNSNTVDFNMELNNNTAFQLGFTINGSGLTGGASVGFKTQTGNSINNTILQETTTGYYLGDQNPGDYYSIDIKEDKVYGTPVFSLAAGASSCPPEPGAQSRDMPQIIITNPILNNVPANGEGFTNLNLVNKSDSREARNYQLTLDNSTSNGVIAKVNGSVLGSSDVIPINNLGYLESRPITVSFSRTNPNDTVFSFPNITFILSDACNGGVSASNNVSVNFVSPCGGITLTSPVDGWTSNAADSNKIPFTFADYNVNSIDSVVLQYAKAGSSNWLQGASIERFLITNPTTTTSLWNVAGLPDSIYNVRLKMICTGGNIVYTPRVTGVLDRRAPILLGRPQPADNMYATGDEISFTYSESINTGDLNNNKVAMQQVLNNNIIPVTVSGFGNKIVVVPSVNLFAFVGDSIRVIVSNISDVYGNIKPTADTLFFVVGNAPVAAGNAQVKMYVTPAAVAENAGAEMAVHFKLPAKAANVTQVYFNISGNAGFGNDYSVLTDTVFRRIRVGNSSNFILKPMVTLYNGSYGYVFIDSGKTETILHITPVADSVFESDETVGLTLTSGGDYTLSDSVSIVATILNDDLQPPVIITNKPLIVCAADSVTLTATAPPGVTYTSYKWSNNATTQSITVNKSNRYSVTVKDASNRSATASVYVGRSAITSTIATANPQCYGGIGGLQATPIGGVVPYYYKFDSLSADRYQLKNIFKPIKAGTYRLNIKDSIGCIFTTGNIVITEHAPITGTFTKTDATCIGKADGTITINATGGKAPYGYKVGLSGNYNDGNLIKDLKADTYPVYIKDASGCVSPVVPVTIGQNNVTCLSANANANAANELKQSAIALVLTPNPSSEQFTLRVFTNSKEAVQLRVLDINGKNLFMAKGQPEQPFRFGAGFVQGTYLVEVRQGNAVKTLKAIKMK